MLLAEGASQLTGVGMKSDKLKTSICWCAAYFDGIILLLFTPSAFLYWKHASLTYCNFYALSITTKCGKGKVLLQS
jgi:hypothetical protein